ncbi:MAG TPA: hypothetical protein PLJ35_13260 [Anaerolineae bacterium]|nr:hypothetical protein [Anaerolineae bacterium]HOQ99783.1 hypothetical protein [Anaerolineae bacterium]
MSTELTVADEEAIVQAERDDRTAIVLGAAAGALVGGVLVWAYRRALIRQAEEAGVARPMVAIGLPDIARIALGILGLLRQVAELGQ